MARPKKQTVDYFPHDVNGGKTLFIIEKNYGNDGYAFWFKVLELLGSTNGHVIDSRNPDEWEFLLAKTLVSNELATEILDLLSRLSAIDPELWSKGLIWSDNFLKNIADVYKKRKIEIPEKPVILVSDTRNPNSQEFPIPETQFSGVSDNINSQSKVKESKVKESILYTTEINVPTLDQIESISESEALRNIELNKKFKVYSDTYPKKTKKIEAREFFNRLSDDEIEKVIIGAQNVLKLSKTMSSEEYKYLKNQATFISDSEYLDYQASRNDKPQTPVGSRVPEWAKEEKKKVVREW